MWKLFQKAGRNGWEAIIPFYNSWVLVEIAGLNWWYALIIILANVGALSELGLVASLVVVIINFFVSYNLSKKLHKDNGFAVLMWLFSFVMIPIIGFSSKYQYDKDMVVSKNGPIGDNLGNNYNNGYNNGYNNNNSYSNGNGYNNGNNNSYNNDNGYNNGNNNSYNNSNSNNNNFGNYGESQFDSRMEQDFSQRRRFCYNCGNQVIDGSRFCQNCGKEIEK